MGSLEALREVGGCHVCEVHHCYINSVHQSGCRSRKELREGIRQVAMQEIGSGQLNSQFGIFIRVWIRHLGLVQLAVAGLAGPILMSVELRCGREWQTAGTNCGLWLMAQHSAAESVTGVRPRVI